MESLSRDEAAGPADERLEHLVALHRPFIREIVARLTPAYLGVSASEIEQEALIRLWRSLRNEREIRDFRSYVYRVVATAALDAIRAIKERREEPLSMENVTGLTDSAPSPEEVVVKRSLVSQVYERIANLSANRARAVKLHLQGFTSVEIGEFYGWTEAKARNLTYRGLDDLRRMLQRAGINRD